MPRKIKGYSRVESEDVRGWLVRIQRAGKRKSRFISDVTHGGKRKSEKVAREIYARWVTEMPAVKTSRDRIGPRNSTGVVGVHYANDFDDRYKGEYASYVASWLDEDGQRRNIRFSCNKYADDAFELARIAREKKLLDREKILALFARRQKMRANNKAKAAAAKPTPSRKTSVAKASSARAKAARASAPTSTVKLTRTKSSVVRSAAKSTSATKTK